MAQTSGGHLVAKALKAEGVEYIFTLNGGHIYNIYEGCADEGIKVIDFRHEQASGHAAEGWARVTGKPGVSVVTSGPGVTDVVTAVANAFQAPSPMLVIGGMSAFNERLMGELQEFPGVELMRPITKWSEEVADPRRIPEYIATAYRHATTGKPGPVFCQIPMDVLDAKVEESTVVFPKGYRTPARNLGDPEFTKAAAQLLKNARRPVIMAGTDIWLCQACDQLREFAETIKAPVYLNGMARGAMPPGHPNLAALSRRNALLQADVIVLIGVPIDFRMGFGGPKVFNKDAKVIHIMIDPGEIGRNRAVEVGIPGDAGAILGQISDDLRRVGFEPTSGDWVEKMQAEEREMRKNDEPYLNSNATPVNPMRLVKEIGDFLDKDATVVGDGGDIVTAGARVIPIHQPGHWLDPGQFGCLGVGTGFAIATQLARPGKQVLILNGDGAWGLNSMEFDTMVRFKLPVVSVVANNGSWGQTYFGMKKMYGRAIACELSQETRYDKVVEALGGHGELVTRPEQIRPALERSFASGLPACINVVTDPEASFSAIKRGPSLRRI